MGRAMAVQSGALASELPNGAPGCRFERMLTTKKTGMGMGLIISRSIVEAHGGRICAENNSSLGGARFCFTLPAIARVKSTPC
jgi:K+-sensing histidine kinase KdpD